VVDDWPRYYGSDPNDHVFRVAPGGVYATWDGVAGVWVHRAGKDVRDYYSRSIESGEAWPLRTADLDRLAVLVGAPMIDRAGW
jgi:hypothetical protein